MRAPEGCGVGLAFPSVTFPAVALPAAINGSVTGVAFPSATNGSAELTGNATPELAGLGDESQITHE